MENVGVVKLIWQMEKGERIVFGDVDVDEAGHRRMWICLGRYLVRRDGHLS